MGATREAGTVRFIPTPSDLSALAREDTAGIEPPPTASSFERVAAIVLAIDLLRRDSWSADAELSETLHQRFPRTPPLDQPGGFVEASYQYLEPSSISRTQRCTNCVVTSGYGFCGVCHGSGRLGEGSETCSACDGSGQILCSQCDGTGKTVRASIVHVNDHVLRMRRAFLPELPYRTAPRVEALLSALTEPPDALRFELQPGVIGSAYRGASAVRAAEFEGHAFGAALDKAIAAAADIPRYGQVVNSEVRAYAWPLLVARVESGGAAREVVVVRDRSGVAQRIEASSPLA